MLEISGLRVRYGVITALHGISLAVERGEILALLGANGAGKTTTLLTVSGLCRPAEGAIRFEGREIGRLRPHRIVGLGLAQAPEGRMIFGDLTVQENLRMGAYLERNRRVVERSEGPVLDLFPRLKERLSQKAGTLSGGEQQMLAIGRALMSRPRLLLLDEPSLGVAPLLAKSIFEKLVELNRDWGLTIVLVEQNAHAALAIAHRGVVLENGRVALDDTAAALRANPRVRQAYLGLDG